MFFLTAHSRDRYARNRRKAKALVEARGAAAPDYVRHLIRNLDKRRDRAHWHRVAWHVSALLKNQD